MPSLQAQKETDRKKRPKFCVYKGRHKAAKYGGTNHLNITQDTLIKQIAEKEEMNAATVRRLFQSMEDTIFDCLSSASPSEELTIKLWNGIHIERKYVKAKKYSKGMFQNINCPEHVCIKAHVSKYYNRQINQKLFGK